MGEGIIGQLSVVSRQFSVVSGYSQRMESEKANRGRGRAELRSGLQPGGGRHRSLKAHERANRKARTGRRCSRFGKGRIHPMLSTTLLISDLTAVVIALAWVGTGGAAAGRRLLCGRPH